MIDPTGMAAEDGIASTRKKKRVSGEEVERSLNGNEIRIGYSERAARASSNLNNGFLNMYGSGYSTNESSSGDNCCPDNIDPQFSHLTLFGENVGGLLSNALSYADGALTALGGFGLNEKAINRYGNTGLRFRTNLFGSKLLRLKGILGQKIAGALKVGGPLLSYGSIAYTWTTDQSFGWKTADTIFSAAGIYGGALGAGVSLTYTFGAKPLIQITQELNRSMNKAINDMAKYGVGNYGAPDNYYR